MYHENKVLTDIFRRSMQQQMAWWDEQYTRTSDQLKRLSTIKDPKDFIHFQKECFKENTAATLETIQTITETTIKNVEEITKAYSTMGEQVTTAATKANEKNVK